VRCIACDKLLDDAEATNKRQCPDGTVEYYDMCRWCLHQSMTVSELEDIYEERQHYSYDDNSGDEDDDPYRDEIDW
jgi:hypothetical protein